MRDRDAPEEVQVGDLADAVPVAVGEVVDAVVHCDVQCTWDWGS